MRSQRVLDERLRQRKADLPQVLGIGAQHHDLVRRHPRHNHQPVEVVVLDLAAENAAKRVLEDLIQCVDLDHGVGGRSHHAEVVYPDRAHGKRRDAMRMLVEHLQPHVLQHRQAVRERHRRTQMEDLETKHARCRLEGQVKTHAQGLLGGQFRHHFDIGHRRARRDFLAVSRRKRVAELAMQFVAARLARGLDQRVTQVIVPAPRRGHQARLHLAHVEVGNFPGSGAHGDLDARQPGFGQVDVELRAAPVERFGENRLPLLAQFGRVVFAWRVDEARQETLERIAPHEQPEPLALSQMEDRHRRTQQIFLGGLEQLVTRIVRENVDERLAGMAAGCQACARDDFGGLAPEERNVDRVGAVSGRGEEAQEAILAGHVALGVEALDRDVVEIARAMHGGTCGGLGDDQKFRPPRVRAHLGRQRGKTRRDVLARALAQDAHARAGHDLQCVLAVHRHEFVAAIAQEREVIVGEPAQEGASLLEFLGWNRRRALFDFRDNTQHLVEHALPVGNRQPHVTQHAGHVRGQRLQLRGIGDAVDFDVDKRFALRFRPAFRA